MLQAYVPVLDCKSSPYLLITTTQEHHKQLKLSYSWSEKFRFMLCEILKYFVWYIILFPLGSHVFLILNFLVAI